MADYRFEEIEQKWQQYWDNEGIYTIQINHKKPKYYVLDMFPYPSGAGLHVGHPLGYIASDIYSRFKRLKGFNVLHPMGFDAFGLPAEQYAIQTGQHPAVTTGKNIKRYKEQLNKIGFSYDWNREVITSDPNYYKWTQWTFIQLFHHWYDTSLQKARPINELVSHFGQHGTQNLAAASSEDLHFSDKEWNQKNEKEQADILMNYRLAYQAETTVNWCAELGTVLANDEVKDGLSVRGGHPVAQKSMKQWLLRVSAYSERLLQGLENLDWSDSLKEMQRNWIGKSIGAEIWFQLEDSDTQILVFTTRPDTLFGSSFMVLAPEHPLVPQICKPEYEKEVKNYIAKTAKRTERERLADSKTVSGQFTGAYAIHPFTGDKLPVYIADYVLIQYGTGAIMAVPAHDSRDYAFAKHFNLTIKQVVKGGDISQEAFEAKDGIMMNSSFLDRLKVSDAIDEMIKQLEKKGIGHAKINYRMRDAIFSRQRYWGEPFPVYYKNGIAHTLSEDELPLELPEVDKYLPTEDGQPPLGRAKNWKTKEGYDLELDTMPGFAGSSAYYLRYMDPKNNQRYFSEEAVNYWQDVDLYIGGTEHATGHLIYSRFWNKFLHDLGYSVKDEPFKKLVNQGMIQGRSSFVYRLNIEKYAEYILWERIKNRQLDCEFKRNFKDGHRQFDFYCEKNKLVLEIKTWDKLEKLESRYADYFEKSEYKVLMIPAYKVIYDIDDVIEKIKISAQKEEPFTFMQHDHKKLPPIFVSAHYENRELFTSELHVDVNIVENDILDIEAFKAWRPEFKDAEFWTEDGKYHCGYGIEKMSKSMFNVVNPDKIIEKYGADTFRMYEMFLGPINDHKPWNTDGIEGVSKFIRRFWNLYFNDQDEFFLSEEAATAEELKILHKCIKKIGDDIEKLAFNTCISTFMITVNDLSKLKSNKKDILIPLMILMAPFAPHVTEELWHLADQKGSIADASFPEYVASYTVENEWEYPVSVNGKMRAKINLPLDISKEQAEKMVTELETIKKWVEGKTIRKIIFVPKKIINIVIG